nr:MAG TPA: hypothetical protein [Bacteriophage sp.]
MLLSCFSPSFPYNVITTPLRLNTYRKEDFYGRPY